jgi:hypothetical protein
MRITRHTIIAFCFLALACMAGCAEKVEVDPCMDTKWAQSKEYEIKLAVNVLSNNPSLPGGTPGSEYPGDFKNMTVEGTIQKIDCAGVKDNLYNLGSSSITMGTDVPAQIDVPQSYWIGYIVYVYQLENDDDRLNVNLTVKVTMPDDQSYMCTVSEVIYSPRIKMASGGMFYYILLDIYSDNWIRV